MAGAGGGAPERKRAPAPRSRAKSASGGAKAPGAGGGGKERGGGGKPGGVKKGGDRAEPRKRERKDAKKVRARARGRRRDAPCRRRGFSEAFCARLLQRSCFSRAKKKAKKKGERQRARAALGRTHPRAEGRAPEADGASRVEASRGPPPLRPRAAQHLLAPRLWLARASRARARTPFFCFFEVPRTHRWRRAGAARGHAWRMARAATGGGSGCPARADGRRG